MPEFRFLPDADLFSRMRFGFYSPVFRGNFRSDVSEGSFSCVARPAGGFVPPRNPHDDYVLFADWAEASDWLQRCGGLEEEAVALGGHALQACPPRGRGLGLDRTNYGSQSSP